MLKNYDLFLLLISLLFVDTFIRFLIVRSFFFPSFCLSVLLSLLCLRFPYAGFNCHDVTSVYTSTLYIDPHPHIHFHKQRKHEHWNLRYFNICLSDILFFHFTPRNLFFTDLFRHFKLNNRDQERLIPGWKSIYDGFVPCSKSLLDNTRCPKNVSGISSSAEASGVPV